MSDLSSPNSSLRRLFAAVFSFETVFVLYLFAGFYKADSRLAWVPVDLTLLFLGLSLIAGGWVLWKRGFRVSKNGAAVVLAMVIFAGWMLLSLLWAPRTHYGFEKATQFAILNIWALAGAAIVIGGDRKRLWRFYYALLGLSLLFALETMRIYLPHADVRSYLVLGSSYQNIGRLVGLGLIVALGAFLDHEGGAWKRWLTFVLSLIFFFVLLFVGARGPFLAAGVAALAILVLARRRFKYKLVWASALIIVYLAGSWWMGPSLRTMYRFNVILAHEIGWEMPAGRPAITPTPPATLQPESGPTRPPSSPQPTPLSTPKPAEAVEEKTQPTPQLAPTPRPTPEPRILKPEEVSNESVDLRRKRFVDAWRIWLTAPILGAGAGSFAYFYPADQLRVYPHNMVLEILSELGLVGFLLWLGLLLMAFRPFIKAGKWRVALSTIAIGFFLFTFINAMVSGDLASNRHFFTGLGLLVATSDLWMSKA